MLSPELLLAKMYAEGRTNSEIAARLDISHNAARKRKIRLRDKLRREHISVHEYIKSLSTSSAPTTPQEAIVADIAERTARTHKVTLDSKYNHAIDEVRRLQDEVSALLTIQRATTAIRPIVAKPGTKEATAVIVASDWHIEEEVIPSTVNFVNEFNLNIARKRVDAFADNSVKLLDMFGKTIPIKNLVIALLGDFISGHIHDELKEICQLPPVSAAIEAKNNLISAIEHIWDNTSLDRITIICKVGNHGRITERPNHTTELGNSLELFIYDAIHAHFSQPKYGGKIEVRVDDAYHSYLNVYGFTMRFHHGHNLKYQGGVGGLYIPVHKAIDQWNKAIHADLDVFGHWHQYISSKQFVCNGSLIGFNPYAISIKAAYETPQQAFFMIDNRGRKICSTPIFLD